jgi:prolyl oligopeptidase
LKPDDHFYYSYNSGLQPQSIIYRVHKDKLPAVYDEQTTPEAEELYFDSNRLSDDATAALSATAFSKSGKYWAYGVSNSGSDWFTVYVRKTTSPHEKQAAGSVIKPRDTGRLDDVVRFVKYCGITWLHNDSGFIYQRFPTQELDHNLGTETDTAQNSMLFFHKLGTKQEDDVLIMKAEEHPDWMFGCQVTEDGRYLIMQSSRDTSPKNLTWILDLKGVDFTAKDFDRSKLEWKKVVNDFRASHDYIANDDTKFWFTTNDSAPKSKLVTYDLSKPEEVGVLVDLCLGKPLTKHIFSCRVSKTSSLKIRRLS